MLNGQSALRAAPGDRLVIRGHRVGEPEHDAEVLEVLGDDGGPPFLVRWEDSGRVSRLYPSSDAYIEHFAHEPAHALPHNDIAGEYRDMAADWEAATTPADS